MKKIISVLMIIALISGIATSAISSAVQTTENTIDAEKFANEVAAMVYAEKEKSRLPDEAEISSTELSDFKCARLIVKCSKQINTLNAVSVISGYNDLWVLQFDSEQSASEAYDYYRSRSGIEYVEIDKEVFALDDSEGEAVVMTESKEYISWGPKHIGMDVLNDAIIDKQTAVSSVYVAVIDTGVDPNHTFLEGRVLPTKINTSSSGIRNNSADDAGHGTQVAGIIADCTLDNVYIKPYKALDKYGNGTVISVASCINCAVRDNVNVINISAGFEEDSEVLREAVNNAEQNNITVVSSAGNDASDTLYYPASYESVIKVAAVNNMNVIANFSTYGTDVDFAAPGVDIKTTSLNDSYVVVKGTSFASPFVASVAATIIGIDSRISNEDIHELLASEAVQIFETEPTLRCGNGVVHAPEFDKASLNGKEKTHAPVFSLKSSFYSREIDIEISCDTSDAVIYYTTDRTVPSKSNSSAMIYDGNPIHASQTIIINAVAYSDGRYRSAVSNFSAIVAPTVNESDISVDDDGKITSYSGSSLSFTVPDTVNGIAVTAVGDEAFKNLPITEIILPDTVTQIGNESFAQCTKLKTVVADNVVKIGEKAFYNCESFRNPYFNSLESIGAYSFFNVCSKEFIVSERTFSLNLKNLTSIPEGAFMNCAISSVTLNNISFIGKDAFLGCEALAGIEIDNLSSFPDGAFKGCRSLASVYIGEITFVPKGAFSTCENLKTVNIPNATFIGSNAFENCVSLVEVSLNSAQTVNSNAFDGCNSLRTLNLPSMTEFEATLYTSDTKPLLPKNLETFKAPKLETIVSDMFISSNKIKNIYLNSVKELPEYSFRGCHDIFILNIENVTYTAKNSLTYCTIEFIDARNLVSADDMPDNSGILLSNQFIESTDQAENLTVYGTPNTFVEYYSQHKGYNFVSIPLIYNETPEYITENSETIYITAVGFDLKYQWYWNTVKSTENGIAIEGATTRSYTFTDRDTAPYYYCIITQNDRNVISSVCTDIITKDTVPADYTEYNEAVSQAKSLNRSLYQDLSDLDKALKVDVSGRYSCEQEIVDEQTQAILSAISNLKLKVAKKISLYASETELRIFEKVKILAVVSPTDAIYSNVEWSTDNPDVILLTKNGYARCIGNGAAIVYATVQNADGSETVGEISIECDLTQFEIILGYLFKYFFIFINYTQSIKF